MYVSLRVVKIATRDVGNGMYVCDSQHMHSQRCDADIGVAAHAALLLLLVLVTMVAVHAVRSENIHKL